MIWYIIHDNFYTKLQVTSSMGRSTIYDMPTEGEFCPSKTLSGKQEVGKIFETSGGNLVQEMRYNDSGDMAAVIKHKVEDGKLLVDMKCKDIICRSVYVKK